MFGYVSFNTIVNELEDAIKKHQPDSDICRLLNAICNKYNSLKNALLELLTKKKIEHYIRNGDEIFFKNEKDSTRFKKIIQTAADLLSIKIRIVHDSISFEIKPLQTRKLKISDPVVLRLSDPELEVDQFFESVETVSIVASRKF